MKPLMHAARLQRGPEEPYLIYIYKCVCPIFRVAVKLWGACGRTPVGIVVPQSVEVVPLLLEFE